MITLDAIVAGADLTSLSRDEAIALLHALAAAQARVAGVLAESTGKGAVEDCSLGIDEAAHVLGESRDWLYRRTKRLPFLVRLDGHLRFSAAGIQKFIAARTGR